jgi:hypothetical protein
MKCQTSGCGNEAIKHRKICAKCQSRQLKISHPHTYYLNALRNNAHRRGKYFNLTLDQFKEFCKNTSYMENKGRNGNSMSIDRVDPAKGYTIDNIRVISVSENTKRANCPF